MKNIKFKLPWLVAALFAVGFVVMGGVVLALPKVETTQQKVKTLKFSFDYKDVLSCPQTFGPKSLDLYDLPPGTQIISSYFRVRTQFHNSTMSQFDAQANVTDGMDATQTSARLTETGYQGLNKMYSWISENNSHVSILFETDSSDWSTLDAGKADLYINYIAQ